jgi:hypothetical protein
MRDRVLVRVTPPGPFITVQELKAHLKIEWPDEDAYLESLVDVACALLDGRDGKLGRALAVQSWDLRLGSIWHTAPRAEPAPIWAPWWEWHGTALGWGVVIPLPPLRSITWVKYRDAAGALQTLAPEFYEAELGSDEPARLFFRNWNRPAMYGSPDALQVRFEAGYDPAVAANPQADPPVVAQKSKVPPQARQAALLQAAALYQNRENPPTVLTGAALALVESIRVLQW